MFVEIQHIGNLVDVATNEEIINNLIDKPKQKKCGKNTGRNRDK